MNNMYDKAKRFIFQLIANSPVLKWRVQQSFILQIEANNWSIIINIFSLLEH